MDIPVLAMRSDPVARAASVRCSSLHSPSLRFTRQNKSFQNKTRTPCREITNNTRNHEYLAQQATGNSTRSVRVFHQSASTVQSVLLYPLGKIATDAINQTLTCCCNQYQFFNYIQNMNHNAYVILSRNKSQNILGSVPEF